MQFGHRKPDYPLPAQFVGGITKEKIRPADPKIQTKTTAYINPISLDANRSKIFADSGHDAQMIQTCLDLGAMVIEEVYKRTGKLVSPVQAFVDRHGVDGVMRLLASGYIIDGITDKKTAQAYVKNTESETINAVIDSVVKEIL